MLSEDSSAGVFRASLCWTGPALGKGTAAFWAFLEEATGPLNGSMEQLALQENGSSYPTCRSGQSEDWLLKVRGVPLGQPQGLCQALGLQGGHCKLHAA